MRFRIALPAALGLLLALAACSSSSTSDWTPLPSGAEPPAACARADADGVIEISGEGLLFSAPCMVAPAGVDFVVRLTNLESMPHNVAIYDDRARGTKHLEGDIITGPDKTIDYAVEALTAGDYYFECSLHPPQMNGALYVR
ncbi:MAG TPA: cupredoxin domain-containing protein [Candidatus Limnocylindria bacterium]|nr:cupredoxin domain-containing protein [Candidatus Limnocylindria bacterium]